ncbi:MAG TPA: hypothetical protein VIG93_07460 [Gaiellaceae bacterium]
MTADIESARRDWQEAFRRLADEEARDPRRGEPLRIQHELIVDELHKRVGSRFTLGELASEYARSDAWVRSIVAERAAFPGWPRTLSVVEGAAFYVYSRGAQDYEP